MNWAPALATFQATSWRKIFGKQIPIPVAILQSLAVDDASGQEAALPRARHWACSRRVRSACVAALQVFMLHILHDAAFGA